MIVFIVLDFVSGKSKFGSQIEKVLWDGLERVDIWTTQRFGFHIIYFSKSVRDKCFNCRRLKTSAFVSTALNQAGIDFLISHKNFL